jgi:hypothetical protein
MIRGTKMNIKRRNFLKNFMGSAAAMSLSTMNKTIHGAGKKKPNVIVIMGKDAG